jgi:hypothetical protein
MAGANILITKLLLVMEHEMSQASRPSADIANSGWIPTSGYFLRINEPIPRDSTFVESSIDPENDAFVVKLSDLAWPRSGPQSLKVRLRETSSAGTKVTCSLLQGTRLISQQEFVATTSFQTEIITLSEAESGSITDYPNLRLRVSVGTGGDGTACETPYTLPGGLPFGEGYYPITLDPGDTRWFLVDGGSLGGYAELPDAGNISSYSVDCVYLAGPGNPSVLIPPGICKVKCENPFLIPSNVLHIVNG